MIFPFFGLTPEYKIDLHKLIFHIVTYGKGGWTWSDLYHNIPVFLRNYYVSEMVKAFQAEREAMERGSKNDGKLVKREDGKTTIMPPVKPTRK